MAKKYNITAVAKCVTFQNSIDYMDKAPKIRKGKKLFTSPQYHRKTRLNQS
ncbi:hypothetical protein [Wolbachia endosymbiont of Litomosoides sigmodontis]|uniref:hypothetical protein n=1 Tax=Wolbachia endosymbiont of Litomosoides sigmodontis TaxID=80850 RepID=UPI001C552EAD|nr:hypothetical protein [Wolbachia endosymbiont of Litomosoides sigmodontis]